MQNTFRILRERKGLSQQNVADQMGITQQAVAKWEAGTCYPRGKTLDKLASILSCTIDELYGKSPPGAERKTNRDYFK